jgi:hypothetical protein
MTDRAQLALPFDLPPVAALPRPVGLEEVEIDGVRYLDYLGDEHPHRVFGWYYGYPACCVEAFIERRGQRPYELQQHPVSGHLLCAACAHGPLAPLPTRAAERFGFIFWNDDGEPDLRPPSLYRPPWQVPRT